MSNQTQGSRRSASASLPCSGPCASGEVEDPYLAPGGPTEAHHDLSAMGIVDLLALLPEIEADIESGQRRLRECVALLRARRASWREIGDALRVSRQAAWERFQPADDD